MRTTCLKQELGHDHIHLDAVNKKVNKLIEKVETLINVGAGEIARTDKTMTEINMLFEQVKNLTNRISGIEEKLLDGYVIVPKHLVDYGVGENEEKSNG